MSLALTSPLMTVEQFLEWPGDHLHHLHALIDGEPVAMDPGAVSHAVISGNLVGVLANHLAATRPQCRVLVGPGVQPRAGAAYNLRIPDLAVACPPLGDRLLTNPLIIIEILSPSNVGETREAIRACLSIPTLREVLVIDSASVGAEWLARDADGAWPADPTVLRTGADIMLVGIDFRTPLARLYDGTVLAAR